MKWRDDTINDLRSFKAFCDVGMVTFNIDERLYVIKEVRGLKTILIIDTMQDNKIIYFDNSLSYNTSLSGVFSYLVEAYSLDNHYKEPREYMEGVFDLLKGQSPEGYIVTRNPDDKIVTYLASRNLKLYFDNEGKLTLLKLLSRDEFFNPNNILNGARVTIYLKGALAVSTSMENLLKQEVVQ